MDRRSFISNFTAFSGGRLPRPGTAIGTGNHYDETAGGATPWGSWISCEETTLGPTVRTSSKGVKSGGFLKPHGYCFEVFASANNNLPPVPLKAMGRFIHEPVAVDPLSKIVTEDYVSAGFYRFLPKRSKRLAEGSVLQMLSIKDKPNYDTRTGQKQGTTFAANWITIDNPDPPEADIDDLAVYKQGRAKGAATFARLEGTFAGERGNIYFVSTNGGDKKGWQVWLYEPAGRDEGRLTLVFESPDREILDMPDNICLRPGTSHLFICEDSDYVSVGGSPDNFVRILAPNGRMAELARNITPNLVTSEFAGSTFSHDGKTLLVNFQAVGATFAIWGDWNAF